MRIRRRPQSYSLQPSDPSTSTAPGTPQNAARNQECHEGGEEEGKLHAGVDLGQKSGVARRLALPQDNAVDCVKTPGAQQGAEDIHMSLVNGHRGPGLRDSVTCNGGGVGGKSEPAAKADGLVSNGVAVAAAVIAGVKGEKNGSSNGSGAGGAKKRRGPAVLMEGSRCSRVNGRGWRCSQPTLVGYSLCEHHLGKGRMRSVAGGGRGGAGQLGRTEHRPRIPAAVAPKAEVPGLRRC